HWVEEANGRARRPARHPEEIARLPVPAARTGALARRRAGALHRGAGAGLGHRELVARGRVADEHVAVGPGARDARLAVVRAEDADLRDVVVARSSDVGLVGC